MFVPKPLPGSKFTPSPWYFYEWKGYKEDLVVYIDVAVHFSIIVLPQEAKGKVTTRNVDGPSNCKGRILDINDKLRYIYLSLSVEHHVICDLYFSFIFLKSFYINNNSFFKFWSVHVITFPPFSSLVPQVRHWPTLTSWLYWVMGVWSVIFLKISCLIFRHDVIFLIFVFIIKFFFNKRRSFIVPLSLILHFYFSLTGTYLQFRCVSKWPQAMY